MERRARLLGLDRRNKTEVTGADGAAIEITNVTLDELEALIGIAEEAARGSE
ncbi:hypothetical protein OHB49_44065 (plasmid) [Streptomyces sp. NBC_01717]|uniref:hypothetical protein n=1 Tax=Streptomyces sp. NBC_01717 TaxID=2975918 RepID=UPI002E34F1AD|nr:hypothetical protein [Streptomyces sp. NBC_01717]